MSDSITKEAAESCLKCGTELTFLAQSEQVDGRFVDEDTICPQCFTQCPICGNWYSAGCTWNMFDVGGLCSNCQ